MAGRSPRMPARCCWARPTGRSGWSGALRPAFAISGGGADRAHGGDAGRAAGVRHRAGLRGPQRPRRHCATTRCWRCWRASLRRGGADCAAVAGKWTLNRLELSRPEPTRYHKIGYDAAAIEALFVDLFLEAHERPPERDHARPRCHRRSAARRIRRAASSTATTTATATCRCTSSAAGICWRPSCGAPTSTPAPGAVEEVARIVAQIRARWPHVRILLRADSGFAREALMAWCEAQRRGLRVRPGQERAADRRDRRRACRGGRGERPTPASRRAASRTSASRRSTAGAGSGASSARPSGRSGEANPRFVVTSLKRAESGSAAALRGHLLRPRRDGEPHQGMPARPVRRPHLGRHHARQPAAAVVRLEPPRPISVSSSAAAAIRLPPTTMTRWSNGISTSNMPNCKGKSPTWSSSRSRTNSGSTAFSSARPSFVSCGTIACSRRMRPCKSTFLIRLARPRHPPQRQIDPAALLQQRRRRRIDAVDAVEAEPSLAAEDDDVAAVQLERRSCASRLGSPTRNRQESPSETETTGAARSCSSRSWCRPIFASRSRN